MASLIDTPPTEVRQFCLMSLFLDLSSRLSPNRLSCNPALSLCAYPLLTETTFTDKPAPNSSDRFDGSGKRRWKHMGGANSNWLAGYRSMQRHPCSAQI